MTNCEIILYGLSSEEQLKYLKELIDQIDYNGSNNIVIQCLVPVFRDSYYLIHDNKELLIRLIDVKQLTNEFIYFTENYIPIAKKYFKNLDYQAESVLLFSNNYLNGLLQKIKDDKNNLIPRKLKLKQLSKL